MKKPKQKQTQSGIGLDAPTCSAPVDLTGSSGEPNPIKSAKLEMLKAKRDLLSAEINQLSLQIGQSGGASNSSPSLGSEASCVSA